MQPRVGGRPEWAWVGSRGGTGAHFRPILPLHVGRLHLPSGEGRLSGGLPVAPLTLSSLWFPLGRMPQAAAQQCCKFLLMSSLSHSCCGT